MPVGTKLNITIGSRIKDIKKTKNEELRIECSLQIHLLNSSFFFIYFRLLQLFNPNITELDRRAMS